MNEEKPRQKDIQFKPITEGLGFHPFSDGLPYASQNLTSKKPNFAPPASSPIGSNRNPSMGAGAVSAGRPVFVTPKNPNPSPFVAPQIPTSRIPGQANRTNMPLPQPQATLSPNSSLHPAAPALEWEVPVAYTLGYSIRRAFGYVIDTIFNLSVAATVLSFALIQTDVELLQNLSDSSLILSGVFLYLCNWAAIAGQEVAFGTSLGKRVFGLSLPGNGSDTFIRAVAFIPCSLFFGFGILASLFDSEKRCWHDRYAHIQPQIES